MNGNNILKVASLTNTTGALTITAHGTSTWSTDLGNLTVQAAGALNLTGTATSTWTIGAGVLTITSADFNADATGVHDTAIGQSGTPQAGTFSNLVANTGLTIGSGGATATITRHLSNTATLTYLAIAAYTASDQTIIVSGAAIGDTVVVGAPSTLNAQMMVTAFVSATNTVKVRLYNPTAGSITPIADTYRVDVWQH